MLPPPQYDHPPVIPVIEKVISYKAMQTCAGSAAPRLEPGWWWNGCSQVVEINGRPTCLIWLLRADDEAVRRHERAHCNGWGRDHAGGVEAKREERSPDREKESR